MFWRLTAILVVVLFALCILFISVFRTAEIKYKFGPNSSTTYSKDEIPKIDYSLASPGSVLPDSPLWTLKAFRDKVWLLTTRNPTRYAEILLLFADKRLAASKLLFEKGESEIGLSTLTKAEKYLESAANKEKENRNKGLETKEFLQVLAIASLKHLEVIKQIYSMASDEVRPYIIQIQDYPLRVYEIARDGLLEKGIKPVENPFSL